MSGTRHCQCLLRYRWHSTDPLVRSTAPAHARIAPRRSFQSQGPRCADGQRRPRTATAFADDFLPAEDQPAAFDRRTPSASEAYENFEGDEEIEQSRQRPPAASRQTRQGRRSQQPLANLSEEARGDNVLSALQALLVREAHSPPAVRFHGPRDRAGLFEAIQRGTPERIAHTLSAASHDHGFLHSLSGSTWTEILRRLNPARWLERTPEHFGLFMEKQEGHISSSSPIPSTSVETLQRALSEIVRVRRGAGIPLTFVDYKILLSHARALNNVRMAKALMRDMEMDGIVPDIDCWNDFSQTLLLNDDQRVSLLKHGRYVPRQGSRPPKLWKDGIMKRIRPMFDQMLETPGAAFDTRSYCTYMLALARDGQVESVGKVLKRVWDVDALDSSHRPTEPVDKEGVQRRGHMPTTALFKTIAEIYGSQGRVGTAFQLIDQLAGRFDLKMRATVWRSLLFWTWMNARLRQNEIKAKTRAQRERRHEEMQSQFFDPSKITQEPTARAATEPLESFGVLFSEAEDEVANGGAQLSLLHMKFFTSLGQWMTGSEKFTDPISRGKAIHARFLDEHIRAQRAANTLLGQETDGPNSRGIRNAGSIPSTTGPQAATEVRRKELDVRAAENLLRTWARAVIETGVSKTSYDNATEEQQAQIDGWRVRGIPGFIEDNVIYLPQQLRYQVPTGVVEVRIDGRLPRKTLQNQVWRMHRRERREQGQMQDRLREKYVLRRARPDMYGGAESADGEMPLVTA